MRLSFDAEIFESDFVASAHKLINGMLRKGQAEIGEDGVVWIKTEEQDKPIIVRKSNNTSLYLSRYP